LKKLKGFCVTSEFSVKTMDKKVKELLLELSKVDTKKVTLGLLLTASLISVLGFEVDWDFPD